MEFLAISVLKAPSTDFHESNFESFHLHSRYIVQILVHFTKWDPKGDQKGDQKGDPKGNPKGGSKKFMVQKRKTMLLTATSKSEIFPSLV